MKKVKYIEHGLNCNSCLNYSHRLDSCNFLLRYGCSGYQCNIYKQEYIVSFRDDFVNMTTNIANNMGVKLKDNLYPIELNKGYSCPLHSHLESKFVDRSIVYCLSKLDKKRRSLQMDTANNQILINKIITPDGTELISRHQHDYVSHTDKKSKEVYFTDGGLAYIRRSVNKVPYIDCTVRTNDHISRIRLHMEWGTYGKTGKESLTYIKIYKMSNAHVQALAKSGNPIFKQELAYRKEHKIFIED